MKYQTEYQRNYQRRVPRKVDESKADERRLNDVPLRRASSLSPSRRQDRPSFVPGRRTDQQAARIEPREEFTKPHLYQPALDDARVTKSKEFAILGRNEKLHDNIAYPLRKTNADEASAVEGQRRRRQKSDNHSCGIQTEVGKAPRVSFDPQNGRETIPIRSRNGVRSEYQLQFDWKKRLGDSVSDQMLVEESKLRDRRSDPTLPLTVIDPSEKIRREKTPGIFSSLTYNDVDVDRPRIPKDRVLHGPIVAVPTHTNDISEYQSRYQPIAQGYQPRTRKAFEAEQAQERKRQEIARAERAYTDDESAGGNANLGQGSRPKHAHGTLRRWKSEYQTTYKPFWRFDYKNGKWYKDAEVEESGFNPNLFWYKELMATRKQAGEFRANAQADHFSREHTLQLQTGSGGEKNYRAWDTNDIDDDVISVTSLDRDAERQRQSDKQAQQWSDERIQSKIHYDREKDGEKPLPVNPPSAARTDHQVDRVVYIDNPPPRQPTMATKAFIRNLDSSSVQQQMVWDSESSISQRTNSDVDFKSNKARDLHRQHYIHGDTRNPTDVVRQASSLSLRPATSHQDRSHLAAGRASFDTHTIDKRPPIRPHTSMSDYRPSLHPSASKLSFHSHLDSLNERYDHGSNGYKREVEDDVLSISSARSLSSSCSLASQTLELAQQNLSKYWGPPSPVSVQSSQKTYGSKY